MVDMARKVEMVRNNERKEGRAMRSSAAELQVAPGCSVFTSGFHHSLLASHLSIVFSIPIYGSGEVLRGVP